MHSYISHIMYAYTHTHQCLLPPQIQDAKAPVDGPAGGDGGYASTGRRYGAGNQNTAAPVNAFSGSAMKLGSQGGAGGAQGGSGGKETGGVQADSGAERDKARSARLAAMEKRAAAGANE